MVDNGNHGDIRVIPDKAFPSGWSFARGRASVVKESWHNIGNLGSLRLLAVLLAALSTVDSVAADPWDPPLGHYGSATATGELLKQQLTDVMSADHIERRYGDFKQSTAIHDQDPDHPGNILLVYSRDSVPAQWDAGNTWSREHLWPQSRQPSEAIDSTRGHLGDPHALRRVVPAVLPTGDLGLDRLAKAFVC